MGQMQCITQKATVAFFRETRASSGQSVSQLNQCAAWAATESVVTLLYGRDANTSDHQICGAVLKKVQFLCRTLYELELAFNFGRCFGALECLFDEFLGTLYHLCTWVYPDDTFERKQLDRCLT